MNPMLACGPTLSDLLIMLSPPLSCAAAFGGGIVCSVMGNKKVGTWTMVVSGLLGLFSFAWLARF